jgi:hypothetical protein
MRLDDHTSNWIESIFALAHGFNSKAESLLGFTPSALPSKVSVGMPGPKLHEIPEYDGRSKVVLRQVNHDVGHEIALPDE